MNVNLYDLAYDLEKGVRESDEYKELQRYIEAINIVGITFKYTSHGIESLCRAKKLFYVTSAGGTIVDDSFGFGYIKALANTLYGISDVQMFKAEGLDIVGADKDAIMRKVFEDIDAVL